MKNLLQGATASKRENGKGEGGPDRHPFEPVEPVPPNQPIACEDQLEPVKASPSATFIRRVVLNAHQGFRRSIKKLLALMAATPPVAYLLSELFTVISQRLNISALSNGVIIDLFVLVITVAILAVTTIFLMHMVERRFTLIRRQFDFAEEAISVDNQSHIQNAVITLQKAFTYRIVLVRWLRDARDFVIVASVFGLLLAMLFVTNYPQVLQYLSPGQYAGWLSVAAFDFAMLLLVMNRLLYVAGNCPQSIPTSPVINRLDTLLTEVKELRRGLRV